MKRIKLARQRKKISQKELADSLNITQQAISYYENGSRIPDEYILLEISKKLDVPVEYLKEESNDPDGWDLWEKHTGYSVEQINNEINRIKEANHIIGDKNNLQNLISQAVANLEGVGNTDRGILDKISRDIGLLQDELCNKYTDPSKKNINNQSNSQLNIRKASTKTEDLIFDDLSSEAYEQALDVLIEARRKLLNISNDLRLN